MITGASDLVVPGPRFLQGVLGLVLLGRLAAARVGRGDGTGSVGLLLLTDIAGTGQFRVLAALRRLATSTFGVLMSLEPAVAALAGLVVLGERLTAGQVVAVVLVCVASAGATWTAAGARRRGTPDLTP